MLASNINKWLKKKLRKKIKEKENQLRELSSQDDQSGTISSCIDLDIIRTVRAQCAGDTVLHQRGKKK